MIFKKYLCGTLCFSSFSLCLKLKNPTLHRLAGRLAEEGEEAEKKTVPRLVFSPSASPNEKPDFNHSLRSALDVFSPSAAVKAPLYMRFKTLILLSVLLTSVGVFGQSKEDVLDKVNKEIAGSWRLLPDKNTPPPPAGVTETLFEISTITATKSPNVFKYEGMVSGMAVDDEYIFYKDGILALGYTITETTDVVKRTKTTWQYTGVIQNGKMTLLLYNPQNPSQPLSASMMERK